MYGALLAKGGSIVPITGLDEMSLSILDSIARGMKVKDIPASFPVSIDQSKRLSRYNNLLKKAKGQLQPNEVEKIQMIGTKVLYLSPLFKQEDWEGLSEILSSVNESTKRDEYPLLIQALQEKRKRIREFQTDIVRKLNHLKQREQELLQLEQNIKDKQKKIQDEITFLNKYPEKVQLFLIKHLGLYQGKLVLSRRLDSQWQKNLKKKGILEYLQWEYVWLIIDLDGLVEEYLKRIDRRTPLGTEWDYSKEEKRNKNSDYNTPTSSKYRLPDGLAVDLSSSIEDAEEKIKHIESERVTIQKDMKQLRKTSPKTFIEAVEATNTLSAHELKLHGEMQEKALKWLYNKGYIVASEVTLPNGRRADVIGYNEVGHIVIVEVKVSAADFRQDEKWERYLDFCDEFYFLLNDAARPVYDKKEYKGTGLLVRTKNSIKVTKTHTLEHTPIDRSKLHFMINKVLTKKYVFGY